MLFDPSRVQFHIFRLSQSSRALDAATCFCYSFFKSNLC